MNCPNCGQGSLPDGARFCPECGAPLLRAQKPAAQIEVTQEVGRVEGGQVVGVDIGEVSGDVNIGNYTLRIGSIHGGVVNLASPQQQRLPQPRALPVFLLPRKSPRRPSSTVRQGSARPGSCVTWPMSNSPLPSPTGSSSSRRPTTSL